MDYEHQKIIKETDQRDFKATVHIINIRKS